MISIRRSPTSHPAEKQNAKREASALTDNRCFRPRAIDLIANMVLSVISL